MAFVVCPSCGEKGRLPKELIGHRIKCQKCATSFLVSAPTKPAPVAPAVGNETVQVRTFDNIPDRNRIAVDGLEESEWKATAVIPAEGAHDHEPHDTAAPAFTAHHEPHDHVPAVEGRQYKVLTQKDKWFEGKFDAARLEECLNHYAHKGWTVNSMTSAMMPGFGGTVKDELVILLQR
jgi:Domain of unknown function (DUF4177)